MMVLAGCASPRTEKLSTVSENGRWIRWAGKTPMVIYFDDSKERRFAQASEIQVRSGHKGKTRIGDAEYASTYTAFLVSQAD